MRISPKARTGVSVLVVLGMLGMWVYQTYAGQTINPILYAVVIIYALAAGYVVFGKRAFEVARDTYDSLQGDSEDNGGDDSST